MIHNRGLNNKINHIHERGLRIVTIIIKSVTIHQHNFQELAKEIF